MLAEWYGNFALFDKDLYGVISGLATNQQKQSAWHFKLTSFPLPVVAGASGEAAGRRIFNDEPMCATISAYRFD
jgi:hypothetical protein